MWSPFRVKRGFSTRMYANSIWNRIFDEPKKKRNPRTWGLDFFRLNWSKAYRFNEINFDLKNSSPALNLEFQRLLVSYYQVKLGAGVNIFQAVSKRRIKRRSEYRLFNQKNHFDCKKARSKSSQNENFSSKKTFHASSEIWIQVWSSIHSFSGKACWGTHQYRTEYRLASLPIDWLNLTLWTGFRENLGQELLVDSIVSIWKCRICLLRVSSWDSEKKNSNPHCIGREAEVSTSWRH